MIRYTDVHSHSASHLWPWLLTDGALESGRKELIPMVLNNRLSEVESDNLKLLDAPARSSNARGSK